MDISGSYGKQMGADGAIMLASEIAANGALMSLDVSSNALCGCRGETYDALGATLLLDAIGNTCGSQNMLYFVTCVPLTCINHQADGVK